MINGAIAPAETMTAHDMIWVPDVDGLHPVYFSHNSEKKSESPETFGISISLKKAGRAKIGRSPIAYRMDDTYMHDQLFKG